MIPSIHDNVRVSLNMQWKGKPIKDDDGKLWYKNKRVNPGYNWSNIEAPYIDIFDAITIDGFAISPVVKGGHRNKANFISHSLVLVDIDEGMTIQELLQDEFYLKFGAGFYTSPSHTDDNHRFRIIFRLSNDVTSYDDLRFLYIGLMIVFDRADTKCKDGSRLFYGTVNAEHKELTDRVLPEAMVKALIITGQEEEESKNKPTSNNMIDYKPPCDQERKLILELLQQSYIGKYEQWRDIGWGLQSGGFDLEDFQFVTTGMMNKKSPKACEIVWNDGFKKTNKQITMGTVYWFIKERFGPDCFKQFTKKAQSDELENQLIRLQQIKQKIKE